MADSDGTGTRRLRASGLAVATVAALVLVVTGVLTFTVEDPLGGVAEWAGAWAWQPVIVVLALTILLFPDGRLPSRPTSGRPRRSPASRHRWSWC